MLTKFLIVLFDSMNSPSDRINQGDLSLRVGIAKPNFTRRRKGGRNQEKLTKATETYLLTIRLRVIWSPVFDL
jgi:hypothetical protein